MKRKRIRIQTTIEPTEEEYKLLYEEAIETGFNDDGMRSTVVEHIIEHVHDFVGYVHERRNVNCDG